MATLKTSLLGITATMATVVRAYARPMHKSHEDHTMTSQSITRSGRI